MTTKRYNSGDMYYLPISYAQELGANDRYVLSTLVHLQAKATTKFNGKLWFFLPLRKADGKASKSKDYRALSQYFPWLSASALHAIVKRLVKGKYLHVGQHNVRTGDKTLWYSVPEKVCTACKKALVRYFNPQEAVKPLSINCALVLNVIYRDFHIKVTKEDQRLIFNHSALSRDLGMPLSTVNSVFRKLEKLRYLTVTSVNDGKAYALNVPNPCKAKGNGKGRKSVSKLISVVTMEANDYKAAQAMLQQQNAKEKSTAFAHKMNLRQMLEEFYLVQIEREQIALAQEAKKPAKKKRVRRPVLVNKRVSEEEKWDSLPEATRNRIEWTRSKRARNKAAKDARDKLNNSERVVVETVQHPKGQVLAFAPTSADVGTWVTGMGYKYYDDAGEVQYTRDRELALSA